VERPTVINPIFLQTFFSSNPTIEQISRQAIYLDDKAQELLAKGAAAHAKLEDDYAVHCNVTAVDMMDTADELRKVVCEAARFLAVPDWALEYESDEVAMHDAERAHSQLEAA